MARIRNDYESSWFPRLLRWLKGGSDELDQELQAELVDQTRGYTREHIDSLAQERENRLQDRLQQQLENEQSMYEHVRQWSRTKGARLVNWCYRILAVVICVSIIWVLLTTASYLPPFGSPDNPVNNEVSRRYIEQGLQETGAVNIVAGMILDYRAFDTLDQFINEIETLNS